jgi:hypothetical protein
VERNLCAHREHKQGRNVRHWPLRCVADGSDRYRKPRQRMRHSLLVVWAPRPPPQSRDECSRASDIIGRSRICGFHGNRALYPHSLSVVSDSHNNQSQPDGLCTGEAFSYLRFAVVSKEPDFISNVAEKWKQVVRCPALRSGRR